MEIDTDWCLHCSQRTDGTTYCSVKCEYEDQPLLVPSLCRSRSASCANSLSSSSHRGHDRYDHANALVEEDVCMASTSRSAMAWVGAGSGKDETHIQAWAQNIPVGAVPQNDIIPFSPLADSSMPSSSRSSMKSKASSPSRSGSFRRPALVQPVAPSLCMSTPHAARPRPSLPILTPQQQIATITRAKHLRRKSAGDMSASVMSSVLISPPETPEDMDDSGIPDYVYASSRDQTGVQDSVLKATQTFNHAKTYLADTLRSWYCSSPAVPQLSASLRPEVTHTQPKCVTVVPRSRPASPPRAAPPFPKHRSTEETSTLRVPSPLHLPDEDLQSSCLCASPMRTSPSRTPSQIPYPSPSSASYEARERRPVGVVDENIHPAFLFRGRKGRS